MVRATANEKEEWFNIAKENNRSLSQHIRECLNHECTPIIYQKEAGISRIPSHLKGPPTKKKSNIKTEVLNELKKFNISSLKSPPKDSISHITNFYGVPQEVI